jgi:hypothetical protein
MDGRQRVGAVLVVAGLSLVLVGVMGIVMSPGAPAVATASPTPAASPATTGLAAVTTPPVTTPPVTVAPPTITPTPDDETIVRAFFTELESAIKAGTQETMADRLGQPVIDRYGRAACDAFLASREPAPEQVFEILTVHERAPWDYVTDEQTTTVADATTVDARVTGSDAGGVISTEDRALHVQVVDGVVHWFTDCGTPLG